MTNYEAIKAMDKNKLAEWLAFVVGCDCCPVSSEECDNQNTCKNVLLDWLDEKTGDDIIVEHTDGKTIHISHANVVIID